jgi:Clp amino terminal domain, pathogenicity island component
MQRGWSLRTVCRLMTFARGLTPSDHDIPPGAHVPFTNSARQAIERAQAEAARRSSLVDAEHMLVGLVDNNGTAASLLEAERDDDDLRAELTRLIDHPRGS